MRLAIWLLLLGFLIYSENSLRTAGEERLKPLVNGKNPPDLSIGISKEKLINFYEIAGQEGRETYANILMRYDLLYPLSYGLFFAYTISLLVRNFRKRLLSILIFLPLISMLSDFVENAGFILLAYEYPNFDDQLFQIARTAQILKWSMAFASVATIIVLLIANGIRLAMRSKS
ncbi:hypothetical protein JCM31826_00900 [Thermaurantimonas aggregans]|uniref:Uncharacterized protein n=1 Tax=Thermaurantimonas aggregans TaxID=2173829 RepID=A0A401XHY1_9FLAO|nr:hypothetical protein [Thermaurantimonas aggregans]GCD76608.1 hypothetical protein JCM31826_00900 [Thermaurantimonas aggregans]